MNCQYINVLKFIASIYLVIIFSACKVHQNELIETTDSDMTIQVTRLMNSSTDDSSITCKARLIPQKILLDDKNQEIKNALFYRMDSCFYLQIGTKKIYASLVQPVANGVSGSFEYLLQFEKDNNGLDDGDFIYQDKYLNHKKYSLKINANNF